MTDQRALFSRIVSTPFEENTYVVHWQDRNDALVVDPGLEPEKIIRYLNERQIAPAVMLMTHGHSDHIAGAGVLKQRWPECPLVIGAGDAEKLLDPELNLSAFFGVPLICPPADRTVAEGDRVEAAGFEFEVLEIPGHSVGHVVYVWRGQTPHVALVGDVIFAGSIGRTDFPDGDHHQLLDGIRKKLFTLPYDTVLLSGHGPSTTVGREKRDNPFVGEHAR